MTHDPYSPLVPTESLKPRTHAFTLMISLHHDYVNSHPSIHGVFSNLNDDYYSQLLFRWFQYHKINILKTSSYLVPTAVLSPTFQGSFLDTNSNKAQLSGKIPQNYHTFAAFFLISSKSVAFHDPCLPSSTWLKTNRKTSRFPPLTTAASPAISAANSALNIFCCGGPVGNFGCSWRQVSNFFVGSKEVWHRNRASLYPVV